MNIEYGDIDFSQLIPFKDVNNAHLATVKNDKKYYDYSGGMIKSSRCPNDVFSVGYNQRGDYACYSDILLEYVILSYLHKLNINGLPHIYECFRFDDNIAIYGEKRNGKTLDKIKDLTDNQKSSILFQLLYIIYRASVYKFTHHNIQPENIFIEEIPDEFDTFYIENNSYQIPIAGIKVTLLNYSSSRIQVDDTYIFNGNNQENFYPKEYCVPYDQNDDVYNILMLNIVPDMLSDVVEIGEIHQYLYSNDIDKNEDCALNVIRKLFLNQEISVVDKITYTVNDVYQDDNDFFTSTQRKESLLHDYLYMTGFPNLNVVISDLLENKYNRIVYNLLTFYPEYIDDSLLKYTKSEKMIKFITNKKGNVTLLVKNVYANSKYYYTQEWLNMSAKNIIISYHDYKIGINLDNFIITNSSLISEVVYKNDEVDIDQTMSNHKYMMLEPFGLNVIINVDSFDKLINEGKSEIICINNNNIVPGVVYEHVIDISNSRSNFFQNPKNYLTSDEEDWIKRYSNKWDSTINGFLRDPNYFDKAVFNELYHTLDKNKSKDEIISDIMKGIRVIDDLFEKKAYVLQEELITYRGLLNKVNLSSFQYGYLSTSMDIEIAEDFTSQQGFLCIVKIMPGVPIINLTEISLYEVEKEILIPNGMIYSDYEINGRVINITVSPDKKYFSTNLSINEYTVQDILDDTPDQNDKLKCYKNTKSPSGKIVDIWGVKLVKNKFYDLNGHCYSYDTLTKMLINIINTTKVEINSYKFFCDIYSRVLFPTDICIHIIGFVHKFVDINEIYQYFLKVQNFPVLEYLIQNFQTIDTNNNKCMEIVCYFGIVKMFDITYNGNLGKNSIVSTCVSDRVEIIEHIFTKYPFIIDDNLLNTTVKLTSSKIILYLLQKGFDLGNIDKIYNIGIRKKNIELIKYIIANYTISSNMRTIFYIESITNNTNVAKIIYLQL